MTTTTTTRDDDNDDVDDDDDDDDNWYTSSRLGLPLLSSYSLFLFLFSVLLPR